MKVPVHLVQPNFRTATGPFAVEWLPYSIGTLWAYAQAVPDVAANFELAGLWHTRTPIETVVEHIRPGSVVAFSAYIWNWNYCLTLAAAIKRERHDVLTIVGGPEVPENDLSFLASVPQIDIAVVGEGEQSFVSILNAVSSGENLTSAAGCLVRVHGTQQATPRPPRLELEQVPSPYTTGVFDQLLRENPNAHWKAVLETNRGCPYRCSFCDWGSLTLSKVKKFDLSRVRGDIEWFGQHGIREVHFTDANFGMFRERDGEIVDALIEARSRHGAPLEVNGSWAKDSNAEIVAIAQRFTDAGLLRALTFSMQSMSPQVLATIHRRNMAFSKLSSLLELAEEHGVPAYTELILGLPDETYESWVEGLCEILALGQHHSIDIHMAELLRNAEMSSELSRSTHGITSMRVRNYFIIDSDDAPEIEEGMEIVTGTRTLPTEDYCRAFMYSWLVLHFHLYGWTQIAARFLTRGDSTIYREFYDRLLAAVEADGGLIGSEYRRTKAKIEDYLRGTSSVEFDPVSGMATNGKMAMWESQYRFHDSWDESWDFVSRFLSSLLSEAPQLPPLVVSDLITAQREFVSDYREVYPRSFSLKSNVVDVALGRALEVEAGSIAYRAELRGGFGSTHDYMQRLYHRRKHGWGKTKLVRVVPS